MGKKLCLLAIIIVVLGVSVVFVFNPPVYADKTQDETQVRETVQTLMTHLKNKDYLSALKVCCPGMSDEKLKYMEEDFAKPINNGNLILDLKEFSIKDVKVGDNKAYVTVLQSRKLLVTDMPDKDSYSQDYKTVEDIIVLDPTGKGWKIHAPETNGVKSGEFEEMGEKGLSKIFNEMGAVRVLCLYLSIVGVEGCRENMYSIQAALWEYMGKNGKLPDKLSLLVPDYISAIPICPTAGTDTYSSSYKVDQKAESYSLFCQGDWHVPFVQENLSIEAEGGTSYTPLDVCCDNLGFIASSLELYAYDHNGRYPAKLSELVPDYMSAVPSCPSAGRDTYSESYKYSSSLKTFRLYCSGHNHKDKDIPLNYPQYDYDKGLIIKP